MEHVAEKEVLLEIKSLKKYFPVKRDILQKLTRKNQKVVKAVDDVNFKVYKGETLALVGESGCGKSTTGRSLLRLIEPTAGNVYFEGKDIVTYSKQELKNIKKDMQIVFQDPFASLHPRMTVEEIIAEPLSIHKVGSREERRKKVEYLIEKVGLSPQMKKRYPHEFSGGQRQRIGIAKALALNPKFIICDEPVSALDVSVQAQVINLFKELQKQFSLTYLFISHDLSVVKHVSDRVGVMYLGKIVEIANTEDLFSRPAHPYTQALLSARPVIDEKNRMERIVLEGELPTPLNPPSGCRFHTRCPFKMEKCMQVEPTVKDLGTNHQVACHLHS
ncbi:MULTISPECIES: ABC transporter ATP-binding protein [Bacillaceae]|jgi:oligopeptide transport system ATP-binding protein|uniref:Dipeptide ABC transporter ATP-binding protein n=1 Tax=Niallia hominis TaxID=3133173 RepID=A0ABV1F4T9_9BACI|nr:MULTISPECIES: dipeptide ABC transporter ATP-binding protein [Bacillaceae]MCF2650645.1 dipeptide ABC transporter ATP-binding protein [Niallia circulans]MCM3364949.1 dipeptide ABC transporter ATP-binding protein [Niallia sp. MER TA 168]